MVPSGLEPTCAKEAVESPLVTSASCLYLLGALKPIFWKPSFFEIGVLGTDNILNLYINCSGDWLPQEVDSLKIKVQAVVILFLSYQIQSFRSLSPVMGTCMLWPDNLLNKLKWAQSRVRLKCSNRLRGTGFLLGVRTDVSLDGILRSQLAALQGIVRCALYPQRVWLSGQIGPHKLNFWYNPSNCAVTFWCSQIWIPHFVASSIRSCFSSERSVSLASLCRSSIQEMVWFY